MSVLEWLAGCVMAFAYVMSIYYLAEIIRYHWNGDDE